ncbi:DUF488 domain-containing protein [Skermania sp. ID1734]|uniref:DUF488 domain-containing protein n=1 Tax=Skermania sp. ID1734 TaxID=2597516 RepID=UPI00117C719F|nr:DUF488 domain-containing protein [Skermania sp. ID1734]TSD99442.1 DUF488 domain-containing protein [Skermania sp. ID1734]
MLMTGGHGQLDRDELTELFRNAAVESVVDIRRYPGSRAHPDVARDALAQWLPAAGVDYRWEERLGGRRRIPKDAPCEDTWWQVEQFAAYAAYTRTAPFEAALPIVLDEAARRNTLVMCSESVWWRCHRRLVADVAALGFDTVAMHLMHDGRLVPHEVAAGARLRENGLVVWDG